LNMQIRLLLRELVLFYLITGPLLYKHNVNIKKLSLWYSVIGAMFIAIIVITSFL